MYLCVWFSMSAKKKSETRETAPTTVQPLTASGANPAKPASLTPAEFQEWSYALNKVSENRWIVPAVLAAGAAGVFEVIHLGWLFFKWVYYFLR